jgi:hypothetical protein
VRSIDVRLKSLGLGFAALALSGCAVVSDVIRQLPAPAPAPAPAGRQPDFIPMTVPNTSQQSSQQAPARATGNANRLPQVATWQAYRLRAAQLITQANASSSYSGPVPDPLASIPVVQVQLNADGTVRFVDTLRVPKFKPETLEMAKAAVMRASQLNGGFGSVANLPQPYQFAETFLYNDDLKFQLRSVAEGN